MSNPAPSVATAPGAAIIGCGLIGQKRLATLPPGTLKAACDLNLDRARSLAAKVPGCHATSSIAEALNTPGVDFVIIATLNASLAPLAAQALQAGKHVLVEKPAGVRTAEIDQLLKLAKQHQRLVRVGFNHRYHPAFRKALEIIQSGKLGPLMFIRGRYGQGGRIGYDKEWRADPLLSGGGELIDQGVHLIDLAGHLLGPFTTIEGHAATYFWNMPVDDNAFLSLRNATGQTAWLHVSCTEWKNMFSLEIYGRDAKLHMEGLGGSYGVERLYHYQMLPEMGPPETVIHEYPRGDQSWNLELNEFLDDIRLNRPPVPGLLEARAALEVVESIYTRCKLPMAPSKL